MKRFDLSQAALIHCAVHKTGHRLRGNDPIESSDLMHMSDHLKIALEEYFLRPFKSEALWKFTHTTDLALNACNTFVGNILNSPTKRTPLLMESKNILHHLHAQSLHPQIKDGELYVAYFTGAVIDDQTVDAIGIFKSETKIGFLHIDETKEEIEVDVDYGLDMKKIDKAAFIFNTFSGDGYTMLMHDRDKQEAQYWRDDFLGVERLKDDSFHTEGLMRMTLDMIEEVNLSESIHIQVRSYDEVLRWFLENPVYDGELIRTEVFGGETELQNKHEMIEEQYCLNHEIDDAEEINMSRQVVRQVMREYKGVIKLDTGFHIKVDRKAAQFEYIEHGFDDKLQMGFYKIYFRRQDQ